MAVVGAGTAGSACATLLARRGLDVCIVLSPSPFAPERREVLSPSALRMLRQLGLDPFPRSPCRPCRGVLSRWSRDEPAFFDYELCELTPGLTISRSALAQALLDLAVAAGASLTRVRVPFAHHDVRSRFVVDATGRSGRLTPDASTRCDFDRAVCVATDHAGAMRHEDALILERTSNGWWYALSSSSSTCEIAFVTDSDCLPGTSRRREFLSAEYREATLLRASVEGMPGFARVRATDARSSYRRRTVNDKSLAVGDAAIALDPLSGNGIRLALEGAALAADVIEDVVGGHGQDGLRAYGAWCAEAVAREHHARLDTYRRARRTPQDGVFWYRR